MGYLESLLGQGERPIYTTRHHWTAFFGRAWRHFVLLVIGLAIAGAGNLYAERLLGQWWLALPVAQQTFIRATAVFILLVYPTLVLLLRYIRWRADRFVVTNFRVVHVAGILSKRVIDSSLEKVNDVVMCQSFLGRLLDYGNLEILTSSDIGVNKLTRVGRPLAFKKAMHDAKQALEGAHRGHQPTLPQLLSELAALRDRVVITEQEYQTEKAELLQRM